MTVTGPVELAGTGSVSGWAYGYEAPLARLSIPVRVMLDQVSIDEFPKLVRRSFVKLAMGLFTTVC
jgi:hypothetical protein